MNYFRIQYNGLTIDDSSSYLINRTEGLDGLPIRVSEDLLTGDDGGNIWATKYGMRTIAIEGRVFGSTSTEYFTNKAALVSAFSINTSNELVIRMWNGTERAISAKVIVAPIIVEKVGEVTFADFRIELKCNDPFFRDTTAISDSAVLSNGAGFIVPNPVPSPLTNELDSIMNLSNDGDIAVYPTVVFSNAMSNPSLLNSTTGKSFTVGVDLVDGDTLTLYKDTTGFYVKKGASNFMQYFTGEFFTLGTGNNTLKFNASSYSATAKVDVSYYQKYLAIE